MYYEHADRGVSHLSELCLWMGDLFRLGTGRKILKSIRTITVLLATVLLVETGMLTGCGSAAGQAGKTDDASGGAEQSSAQNIPTAGESASGGAASSTAGSSASSAGTETTAAAESSAASGSQEASSDDASNGSTISNIPGSGTEAAAHPDLADNSHTDYILDNNGEQPQVVVFGDSQFDNDRGTNGLSVKLAYYTHCKIYNCAIGGTTATMESYNEYLAPSSYTEPDFSGMVYAATGQAEPEQICGKYYACQVLQGCDLSKTDVFVIEYGVNDYFNNRPLWGGLKADYYGALKQGIAALHAKYPDAKFVLCGPGYAQFYKGDSFVGDSNSMKNSAGNWLYNYTDAVDKLAMKEGYSYLDAYRWVDIGPANASDYLLDGVHMNPDGRQKYVFYLARIVMGALGYNVPSGADLDTLDYSTLTKTAQQ